MSVIAYLPCFKCGKELRNAFVESDNQPNNGTEFRTYGHYGSTFWDSFDCDEELVLNICDDCLRAHTQRLGQQKSHLPVRCQGMTGFGRVPVERPLVAYTGNLDRSTAQYNAEDLGSDPDVEWVRDILERRADLLQ